MEVEVEADIGGGGVRRLAVTEACETEERERGRSERWCRDSSVCFVFLTGCCWACREMDLSHLAGRETVVSSLCAAPAVQRARFG